MRCEEVAELMQLELDSQLDRSQREALHEHLAVCGECAVFYRRLRQIHSGLENLPKVEPPFNVVDSILPELERIDRQRKREQKIALFRKKGFLPATGAVAAAFLLAVFAFAELNQNGQKDFQTANSSSQQLDSGAGPQMEMAATEQSPVAENHAAGAGGSNPPENRNALAISSKNTAKASDSHKSEKDAGSHASVKPGEIADEMMALRKDADKEKPKDSYQAAKPSTPSGQGESGGKMVALKENSSSNQEKAAPNESDEVQMAAAAGNPEAAGNQGEERGKDQLEDQGNVQEGNSKGKEKGEGKAVATRVMERPTLFRAMKEEEASLATKLPSPDQKYLAVYTQTFLEVYQDSEVVFQWEAVDQTFTGLVWIDEKTLQVSIDSKTGSSEWIVNVENGDIVPADSQ